MDKIIETVNEEHHTWNKTFYQFLHQIHQFVGLPTEYSREKCPYYFDGMRCEDTHVRMEELINFKKLLLLNRPHFSHNTLEHCLLHHKFVLGDKKQVEIDFSTLEKIYYRFDPETIKKNEKDIVLHDKIETIETKLKTIESKLKTMEQYQAQILDKLTIFCEMIDDIQTVISKLK